MSQSAVQSLIRLTHNTFAAHKCQSEEVFKESLNKLKKLLSQITGNDVNLNKELMSESQSVLSRFRSRRPPVTYVHICETQHFQVCMFGLRQDKTRIPLHNHPGMYGLIKVLFGCVKIANYTALPIDGQYVLPNEVAKRVRGWRKEYLIPTVFNGQTKVDSESSDVCVLTPSEANYHEVTSVDGPAVILDILGPPYRDERECHYYEVIATVYDQRLGRDISWLLECSDVPNDYRCDSLPYVGPQFELS